MYTIWVSFDIKIYAVYFPEALLVLALCVFPKYFFVLGLHPALFSRHLVMHCVFFYHLFIFIFIFPFGSQMIGHVKSATTVAQSCYLRRILDYPSKANNGAFKCTSLLSIKFNKTQIYFPKIIHIP